MGVGVRLTYTVLDPIDTSNKSPEEITDMCELVIKRALGQE
jgi:hypothetical protein